MHDKIKALLKETMEDNLTDAYADDIIKLFADEGYIKPTFEEIKKDGIVIGYVAAGSKYYTGTEWYDRFEKALPEPIPSIQVDGTDMPWFYKTEVLEAARKAAGL